MAQILPVTNQASSKVSVILGGVTFIVRCRWNTRTQSWYLKVSDSDDNPIINFEKISERQQVIIQNLSSFVDGNIFALPNNTNDGVAISRSNFGMGKAWELVYLTSEEILA